MPEGLYNPRMGAARDDDLSSWYLEGYVDVGRSSWRTIIHSMPLVIGRGSSAGLQLYSEKVSHRHAELYLDGGLQIRDLESTNGTYVNGERVRTTRSLAAGDVIRFGDILLRLASYEVPLSTGTKALSTEELTAFVAEQSDDFLKLLETRAIRPLFQPVFDTRTLSIFGYELLCRGNLEEFETAPAELFFLAEQLDRAVELSRVCREVGFDAAAPLVESAHLFVNSHPSEIPDMRGFLDSLAQLQAGAKGTRLVVEIHEAAMTDIGKMTEIRSALHELGIALAFDDFGTGQSRLQALADVPPDYLKFDMSFVRDLHRVSQRRKILVRRLVSMSRSMGIVPVAEGIESPEELEACLDAGFELAQGHLVAEALSPAAIGELKKRLEKRQFLTAPEE